MNGCKGIRTLAVLVMLCALLTPASVLAAPQSALPPRIALAQITSGEPFTFQDLGYGDQTARTIHGEVSVFIPIPADRAPTDDGEMEIRFSHSPLLNADRSTITVLVNGQSLISEFLTEDNQTSGVLTVPLPMAAFQSEGFFVQIQTYMRLTEEECEETNNPALWTTIHQDSTVTLELDAAADGPGLQQVATLFAPHADASESPIAVVLPENPSPEELEAAGVAAFALGRFAASVGRTTNVVFSTEVAAEQPSVVVALGASLPTTEWEAVTWSGDDFEVDGAAIPNEHGLLAIHSDGVPRLLVSGGSGAALLAAADALADDPSRGLLSGSHAIVTGTSVDGRDTYGWEESAASFAQLGLAEQRVAGGGEHSLDLAFQRPPGWRINADSRIELAIATSTAIRTETSWVAVTVNGIDLGSQQLRAGEDRSTYAFDLPSEQINTTLDGTPLNTLDLRVRINLDLPQEACVVTTPGAAWATILPSSAWYLPHGDAAGLNLALYPAPLVTANSDSPVFVVLPDAPSPAEITAGLLASASLGRLTPHMETVHPRLRTAGTLAAEDRVGAHLLAIGTPERNATIAAAIEAEPDLFTFDELIAYQVPNGSRAEIALATSPWSDQRAMLWLRGSDDDSVVSGAAALNDVAVTRDMRGMAVAIVDSMQPQTTAGAAPVTAPEVLTPEVERETLTERLEAWQVVGAILLGAFIAIVILLVALRWTKRRRTA